jgi:regulator of protease activity HflC (stomatin/prohibitin superfamily)
MINYEKDTGMKKLFILFLLFTLTSCYGDAVTINPGEVGKLLSKDGFEKEIYRPSSFRMSYCQGFGMVCPKLIKMQVSKSMEKLSIDQIFLSKSRVDIEKVEVGIQFQVKKDDASIDKIFSEVPFTLTQSGENLVTTDSVWKVYLQKAVADTVVSIIRNYTIEEILSKIPEISKETLVKLNQELASSPIEITDVSYPNGIGDIPPSVIESFRKLYAVEADKQRRIKELEAALEIEKQKQAIQRVRANNDIEIAKTLSMTPESYVKLKVQEKFADAVADAADNNQPFALGFPSNNTPAPASSK